MSLHNLYRTKAGSVTTAGLIGVGHFGTAILAQCHRMDDVHMAAIASLTRESMADAAKAAGIPDDQVAFCDTAAEAQAAVAAGKLAAVTDPMILMELPLDTIMEGTGNPEAGARYALAALNAGKNLVMVSKEVDSCIGPMLRRIAKEKGLVATPTDGDQHGALMQLVEWARDIGCEILAAGKSRDAEFIYDRAEKTVTVYCDKITIPKTVTTHLSDEECQIMESNDPDKIKECVLKRREILKELDPRGGFDLCEMVCAANATGLVPDTSLLHDFILHTPEVPMVLCGPEYGGMLSQNGVIEVVTNLHEKHEAGMGGGEWIVVHCDNEYSQMILATKGCLNNADGTASLVYRPYHLCGVEAASTLQCIGFAGVGIGGDIAEQRYDIVQEAKVDLKAGDIMGNDHDARLLTHMVPATHMADDQPIPLHMLNGKKLICDVPKGTIITYGMIEKPKNSVLFDLRRQLEEIN